MSNLITKENVKYVFKYIAIGILVVLGMVIATYFVKTVFNLGIYFGTFLRNIYNLVCCS